MRAIRIYHEKYGFIDIDSKEELLEKYLALSASEQVQLICKPLQKLGISYFLYIKRFADGSQIEMTNVGGFSDCYYKNHYYQMDPFGNPFKRYDSGVFFWHTLGCQLIHQAIREKFNVDHGIVVVYKYDNHNEFFHFGARAGQQKIINFYLNNFDLITRFIFYFKDKSSKLCKQLLRQRLMLPAVLVVSEMQDKTSQVQCGRDEFILQTPIDKYHLGDENLYMTSREMECLKWHLIGKTAADIASVLAISVRTVEVHLESIKRKLACTKQTQLGYKCAKLMLPIDF